MKKLLFPTDFSHCAKNGFRYAAQLAKELEAELDLMCVFEVPFSTVNELKPWDMEVLIEEKKLETMGKLAAFVEDTVPDFSGKQLPVYGIFVPEEIIALCEQDKYDLVVVGTKGERNAIDKMLGSITTRTMMNAPCPVLAIPQNCTYQNIQHIAYATDFKASDKLALEQLMAFGGEVGAHINFVHVDTVPDIGGMEDSISLKNYPYDYSEFSIVNNTSIEQGIDDFIEERKVDLLTIFIPKRRLWERLFHRSFSKKYTFHSKVPLLVFHE